MRKDKSICSLLGLGLETYRAFTTCRTDFRNFLFSQCFITKTRSSQRASSKFFCNGEVQKQLVQLCTRIHCQQWRSSTYLLLIFSGSNEQGFLLIWRYAVDRKKPCNSNNSTEMSSGLYQSLKAVAVLHWSNSQKQLITHQWKVSSN